MVDATVKSTLCVFVSAELSDLPAERTAAADAIAQMQLTPILSSHPTRDPGRCDLFVGVYGAGTPTGTEKVAADYDAARALPKLVYVKQVGHRQPGLAELLTRIQEDDQVSYKPFRDADELRDLIQQDLALTLTERFASASSHATRATTRIPRPLTSLIAREAETAHVRSLLLRSDVRLVTLVGAGGIGKTRVALDVAQDVEEHFEEVHFVPLAPVRDADLLGAAIARALGIRQAGGPMFETLGHALHNRAVLLVLDNFEHLLSEARSIAQLLFSTATAKILITSRAVLNVRGEHAVEVPPLAVGEFPGVEAAAIRLFMERATEVRPNIEWDDATVADVVEICRKLDGLPLAIELAAARCRVLSPGDILDRLRYGSGLLTTRARDVPSRQRTLDDTIEWSYRLLEDEEAQMFERLAVFPGRFALPAAEAISPEGLDVPMILASLLDKSLLRRAETREDVPYFGMLETIRQFALRRLAEGDHGWDAHHRYTVWLAEVSERADREARGPLQKRWLQLADIGHDNLRNGLMWARDNDPSMVVAIVKNLFFFWEVRGFLAEGRGWADTALGICDPVDQADRALLHRGAGRLARAEDDLDMATAHHLQALELARNLDDRALEALVLKDLGVVALERGDLEEARALTEESLAMARRLNHDVCLAEALNNLGLIARFEGDWSASRSALEESLAVFRKMGDQQGIARALMNLGTAHRGLTLFDDALDLYKQSLREWYDIGGRWMLAQCMEQIALVTAYRGDTEVAARLLGAAEHLRERVGAPWSGSERELMEEYVAKVATALKESGRETVWDEGRALTVDDAVDLALAV